MSGPAVLDATSSTLASVARRSTSWFSVGALLVFSAVQLTPMVPALLFGAPLPRPALIVSCSSLLVTSVLFGHEWLFRPRARVGVFWALGLSVAIALGVGALGGVCALQLVEYLEGRIDFLPLPPGHPLTVRIVALTGALTSVFPVGQWAIAFVVPGSVEDERTRKLVIQNMRLEASELRTSAELARLRTQLEPHFFLNTLNLVAGLVTMDPSRARSVLVTLGELVTEGMSDTREANTIEEELSWLRRYTDILSARHGEDQLKVFWDVRADAERALLPRLLLQPLVENAVRHGALQRRCGGHVIIRAERIVRDGQDCLKCSVLDNGPGMRESRPGAIGLENVRRCLALSQSSGVLTIESGIDGTTASVTLPFTVEPRTEATMRRSEPC